MKIAKLCLFIFVLVFIGDFYLEEFNKSRLELEQFKFFLHGGYLALALLLCVLSYLTDAFILKLAIHAQSRLKNVTFLQLFAVFFTSGFLRYLPGRIWWFVAQAIWLEKYGISKSFTLYFNLIYLMQLVLFSSYSILLFVGPYAQKLPFQTVLILLAILMTINFLCNRYSHTLFNLIASWAGKMTKSEFPPIRGHSGLMITVQGFYFLSWILIGASAFSLSKGLGLEVFSTDIVPIITSMSSAWLAGYSAVCAPGGFGVREGVMLFILKPFVSLQLALILPIAMRAMSLITEILLGFVAIFVGGAQGFFIIKKSR